MGGGTPVRLHGASVGRGSTLCRCRWLPGFELRLAVERAHLDVIFGIVLRPRQLLRRKMLGLVRQARNPSSCSNSTMVTRSPSSAKTPYARYSRASFRRWPRSSRPTRHIRLDARPQARAKHSHHMASLTSASCLPEQWRAHYRESCRDLYPSQAERSQICRVGSTLFTLTQTADAPRTCRPRLFTGRR